MPTNSAAVLHPQGNRFIRRAMGAPLLTRAREAALARRWREKHDQAAFQELVTAHSRLVISLASKYRGYGLPLADMIQEGHVGLLQAVSKFEPDRGFRLSTYAMWWIKASLTDYVLRNWSIVRLGSTATEKALFFKLRGLKAKLAQASGNPLGEPGAGRLAGWLGTEAANVERMDAILSGGDLSLNAPIGEDGAADRQDTMADERPSPEELTMAAHDDEVRRRWLRQAIDRLPDREALIIRERHMHGAQTTLATLGERLGVSKERVRQLETRAVAALKSMAESGIAAPNTKSRR